jgi:hypothetical protein
MSGYLKHVTISRVSGFIKLKRFEECPENGILHSHCHENLKFTKKICIINAWSTGMADIANDYYANCVQLSKRMPYLR